MKVPSILHALRATKILAALFSFALICPGSAAVYYVDPVNGLDTYDGSALTHGSGSVGPFQTVQKGLDTATTAGDTVYLRSGVYRPNSATHMVGYSTASGTGSNYITLAAYPGERPILKGSEIATGWEAYDLTGGKAIYRTHNWHPGEDFAIRYPQQAFASTYPEYAAGKDGTSLKQLHWIDTTISATAVLTCTGANVAAGATVTIGSKTYTFVTALSTMPTVEGQVLIGANGDATLLNLANAINLTAATGTYTAAAPHPDASASSSVSSHTITIYSRGFGKVGNSMGTTVSGGSNLSFGGSTATGGVDGQTSSTCAKGTLTSTSNVANNDTVTIDGKTYTFKSSLTPAEGEVLIGASATESLQHLVDAINHTGTSSEYHCAAPHSTVRAVSTISSNAMQVGSMLNGIDGNGVTVSETSSALSWGNATLSGGFNGPWGGATGTLTNDGTNVSNGESVTIDAKTYVFKTTLTPSEGEVLIGGTADASLGNLISAINHTGTPGTDYSCAAVHPTVFADTNINSHAFFVTARSSGLGGNSIATTETSAHLSWSGADLTGGYRGGWEAPTPGLYHRFMGTLGSVSTMTAGSFFYDNSDQALYVWLPDGADPTTRVVEVSSTIHVLFVNSFIHLKGLTCRHNNSTSYDFFGFNVVTVETNCLVEDCDIQWGDFGGLSTWDDSLVVNCKLNNNGDVGCNGGHFRTTVTNCQLNSNNYRGFDPGWHGGGGRNVGCSMIYQGCEAAYNNGNGIWFDGGAGSSGPWDGHEAVIVRNCYVHHNIVGIYFETSQHCTAINNVAVANQMGIASMDGDHNVITRNTIAYNYVGGDIINNGSRSSSMWIDYRVGDYPYHDNTFTYNLLIENTAGAVFQMPKNDATYTGNVADYNLYDHSDPTSIRFSYSTTIPGLKTWSQWQTTNGSDNSGYDQHSMIGVPLNTDFTALGFTYTPGADLVAMQALDYTAIHEAFSPLTNPGLSGYLATRPALNTIQTDLSTATGNITTLQAGATTAAGNITTLQSNVSSIQSWQTEPTLGSGKDFIAGYSTGDPSTANFKGGFRYNTDSGQTNGRNWLLSGDAFNWGDFGLYVSASSSANPTLPHIYHDAIANATTIGHNAATHPTGTSTLNVEGSTALIPAASANGNPSSATYILTGQSTNSNRTVELTLPSGAKIPVPVGHTLMVTAHFVCREAAGGSSNAGGFTRSAAARNVSGTTSLVTQVTDYNYSARTNSTLTASIGVDDTTDTLTISGVTNLSATINWAATVEVVDISE